MNQAAQQIKDELMQLLAMQATFTIMLKHRLLFNSGIEETSKVFEKYKELTDQCTLRMEELLMLMHVRQDVFTDRGENGL